MQYLSLIIVTTLYLLISYAVFMISRVVYVLENSGTLGNILQDNSLASLLHGSLLFDTSAIMYTHAVVVLALVVLPKKRYNVVYWLYTVINAVCIVMNLGDAVYFKYTGHRTTASVFSEFSNEGNLMKVFAAETVSHWYLFLTGMAMIVIVFFLSRKILLPFTSEVSTSEVSTPGGMSHGNKIRKMERIRRVALLLFFLPLCIFGIRGGIGRAVRPITLSNANQFVAHPVEAAVVLNTPFSLLRSIGKSVFADPGYFTESEMNAVFSPVHCEQPDTVRRKNVVIIILESFGKDYVGELDFIGPERNQYEILTPFIDFLSNVSLTFRNSFSNGRKSIDAMPSILSSIPHFVEPFFLTPSAMNDVSSIAGELGKEGYYSAFFHGAPNGSMGFEAYARASGFKDYFGMKEYVADKRFGGEKDFDGTWAIWDEPFLQFFALKMSEFKEPFVSTVFTASSHHPYNVPENYAERLKNLIISKTDGALREENPIHKCVKYTDDALRKFFDKAREQPWYENTIFVVTADHTNIVDHDIYGTDIGLFAVPIIFYDPSGEMPQGVSETVCQHTDIMPTLLAWLGYGGKYVAWGKNVIAHDASAKEDSWAVNYSGGIYQYVYGNWLIQFNGKEVTAVYDYCDDPLLKKNLLPSLKTSTDVAMAEKKLKAVIQSYMQRMVTNNLIVREER